MDQEKIGKFIAELRKENKLTQEELAEKLNVNVKSISRWETGKNMPDHSMIVEICNLFKISINEFYNGLRITRTKKVRQIILFYLIVSFTGIFILPFLGISAPTFIVCAVIVPIGALIDLIAKIITGNDIPQILFQFGKITLHPAIAFPVSLIIAIVLFLAGMYLWKLLIKYIRFVSDKRKKLYIDL